MIVYCTCLTKINLLTLLAIPPAQAGGNAKICLSSEVLLHSAAAHVDSRATKTTYVLNLVQRICT